MKSFNTFLIEKINKTEISASWADTNLRIGVEFEFILDDERSEFDGFNMKELTKDWNDIRIETMKFIRTLTKRKGEYGDYLLGIWNSKIKPKLEKDPEKQFVLKQYEVTVKSEDWNELRAILEDEQGYNSGYYIYDEMDWLDEVIKLKFPEGTQALDDFYNEFGNSSGMLDDEIREAVFDVFFQGLRPASTSPIAFWDDEIEPEFPQPEGLRMGEIRTMDREMVIDDPIWKSAPFDVNKAVIGDYHGSEDYSKWRVENDPSLGVKGIEVISPIMTMKEASKKIPQMFAWIDKHGHTDKTTGFHVNLSYKGKGLWSEGDLLKMMMFMDEGDIWKNFPDRKDNHYVMSVLRSIRNDVAQNKSSIKELKQHIDPKLFFKKFVYNITKPENKYFGVNIMNAFGPGNRVEFRYLGGKDYHKKWKLISAQIGRYGHLINLALDPKLKRKEYITKIMRMFDKYVDDSLDKLTTKQLMMIVQKGHRLSANEYQVDNLVYTIGNDYNITNITGAK